MLDQFYKNVHRFNEEILGVNVPATPTKLSKTRQQKRFDHLAEELTEFHDAKTLEEQADALVDLAYVALGGLVEMGLSPSAASELVHLANMSKKKGTNKKRPGNVHDAVKPEGWQPPDWSVLLKTSLDDVKRGVLQREISDSMAKAAVTIPFCPAGETTGRDEFLSRIQPSLFYPGQRVVYDKEGPTVGLQGVEGIVHHGNINGDVNCSVAVQFFTGKALRYVNPRHLTHRVAGVEINIPAKATFHNVANFQGEPPLTVGPGDEITVTTDAAERPSVTITPASEMESRRQKEMAGNVSSKREGKLPMELIPIEALFMECEAWAAGERKYAAYNFQENTPTTRELLGAIARHTYLLAAGQDWDVDPKTGLADKLDAKGRPIYTGAHHLGNIRACCGMLAWQFTHKPELDDRLPVEQRRIKDAPRRTLI